MVISGCIGNWQACPNRWQCLVMMEIGCEWIQMVSIYIIGNWQELARK